MSRCREYVDTYCSNCGRCQEKTYEEKPTINTSNVKEDFVKIVIRDVKRIVNNAASAITVIGANELTNVTPRIVVTSKGGNTSATLTCIGVSTEFMDQLNDCLSESYDVVTATSNLAFVGVTHAENTECTAYYAENFLSQAIQCYTEAIKYDTSNQDFIAILLYGQAFHFMALAYSELAGHVEQDMLVYCRVLKNEVFKDTIYEGTAKTLCAMHITQQGGYGNVQKPNQFYLEFNNLLSHFMEWWADHLPK